MLKILVADELLRRRLSVRKASREIGVAHTTLHRILTEKPVDFETLAKVSTWLGANLADIVNIEARTTGDFYTKLSILIDQHPDFGTALAQLVSRTEEGVIDLSLLNDLAGYITFRIQTNKGDG